MDLKSALAELEELEGNFERVCQGLRGEAVSAQDVIEETLSIPVSAATTLPRACAVDSGFAALELRAVDLLIVKTCGVCFDYDGTTLKKAAHFPSANPLVEAVYSLSLESFELNWFKSVNRLLREIECASACVEKFSPKILLLDGSIAPLVSDKPNSTSPLFGDYLKLVEAYKSLFSACDESGCLLAGVIKDSRGKHLLNLLSTEIPLLMQFSNSLRGASDSLFLSHLLKGGERSCAFNHSSRVNNSILRDLGDFGDRICSFYLRPSSDDYPLRIDFLFKDRDSLSELSSILSGMCSASKRFAYPPILIEADLRAMLDQREIDYATRDISSGRLEPLRRNARPFR
jgi:hypothetical protein